MEDISIYRGNPALILRKAVSTQNIEYVKNALQYEIDTDTLNNCLQIACEIYENIDIMKLLIEHNANVQLDDNKLLIYACDVLNNINIVKLLLENNADVHATNNKYAIQYACYNRNIEIIKLLLEYDADVILSDFRIINEDVGEFLLPYIKELDAALIFACEGKNNKIIKLLIENGANVDAYNSEALTIATRFRNIELIKLLLTHNADPNAGLGFLFNPKIKIPYTEEDTVIEILDLLVDASADISRCDLSDACSYGNTEIVKRLLENRECYNRPCIENIMHIHGTDNKTAIIRLLLEYNVGTVSDYTNIMEEACQYGYVDTIKLLVDNNVVVRPHCLILAVIKSKRETIQFLLDHNVDVNFHWMKNTALSTACHGNDIDNVKLLLNYNAHVDDLALRTTIYSTIYHPDMLEINSEIMRLLLENVTDENIVLNDYLILACKFGKSHIIKYLLKYGADEHYNKPSQSLLTAITGNNVEIMRLLIENNADIYDPIYLQHAHTRKSDLSIALIKKYTC
jgi:ankyrin repeat protein